MSTLLLLIQLAVAGSEPMHATLSRFISSGGIETLSLACPTDPGRPGEYLCDLTRERNGMVVMNARVPASAARDALGRFFSSVPDESPPAEAHGTSLKWDVLHRTRVSRGSSLRGKPDAFKPAVLTLEAELIAYFYK